MNRKTSFKILKNFKAVQKELNLPDSRMIEISMRAVNVEKLITKRKPEQPKNRNLPNNGNINKR